MKKYNTIKEMRDILDACEQGKQIQWYDPDTDTWKDLDINHDNLNFNFIHRIKLKEQKKWRPFRDVQEFIDAARGLGAIWLKKKLSRYSFQVTGLDYAWTQIPICIDSRWLSFKELLEDYTFADGRPCGVEE